MVPWFKDLSEHLHKVLELSKDDGATPGAAVILQIELDKFKTDAEEMEKALDLARTVMDISENRLRQILDRV